MTARPAHERDAGNSAALPHAHAADSATPLHACEAGGSAKSRACVAGGLASSAHARMRTRGRVLIALGLALLLAAGCLAGFNVWDASRAGKSSARALEALSQMTPLSDALQVDAPEASWPMPVATVGDRDYVGVLEVDVLGLELPVLSSWSYEGLREAPCVYAGSAYASDLVIAAHNYPAHFGNLDELEVGDGVVFRDVDGNEFRYRVALVDALSAGAVAEMTSGDWSLTLFTCTLDGTSRITVRCEAA